MKTVRLFATLAITCSLLVASSADAGLITFGSVANQFDMEFVEIGSPDNAADTTGNPSSAGAVSYTYNMGKYEVSRDMITKANLGITMGDMSFVTGGPRGDMPATGVSWFGAAKFVNWLNTERGFQAAYNFDDSGDFQLWSSADAWQLDGENLFRHKDAGFWLPSVDEWYKAAYYNPDTSTYFNFPTGSDTAPAAVSGGTTDGTAVYLQSDSQGPADITNAGGLSPFGVMGMGGNVWEWEETTLDLRNKSTSSSRGFRGGSWIVSSSGLSSSTRFSVNPAFEDLSIGFRVASLSSPAAVVPEPSSLAIWGVMCVGGWHYRKRRLRK